MDDIHEDKPVDRCASHNLAVGPDGACVICRRERAGVGLLPARSRVAGFASVVVASCIGVAFLGGVALARGRRAAPVMEAQTRQTPAVESRPVGPPPDEVPPRLNESEPPVREAMPVPTVVTPAPPPQPQRNYLDEAYAALDKRGLYDSPQPKGHAECVPNVVQQRVPTRYYGGRGYGGYGVGTGAMGSPVRTAGRSASH